MTFQELAEEALGCPLISPALNESIHCVAVLVHGAPELVAASLNGDEDLVQKPGIT
jgi:hypothetical protein